MNEAKNILHVGDVVLTEECINTLRILQEDDNSTLETCINSVLKSIMYISLDPNNEDNPKVMKKKHEIMSDLAIFIEWLEDLKAP